VPETPQPEAPQADDGRTEGAAPNRVSLRGRNRQSAAVEAEQIRLELDYCYY
jgi:hypothetical protein